MAISDANVSTTQLRAVVAVAKCGSFVSAASTLGLSQSSLSRIVQSAEETLSMPLFARSTRRVELTDAGREFVAVAERILNDLGIALRNMEDLRSLRRGQIIVSSLQSFAQGPLAVILSKYADSFRGVEIQLREGVQESVTQDVQSGVSDFGICAVDGLEGEFHVDVLGTESFHLIHSEGTVRADPASLGLQAIDGRRLVSLPLGSRTRALIDAACAAAGIAVDASIVAASFATVISLVRQGAGAAIVPAGIVPSARDAGLQSVALDDRILVRTLGIARLANRTSNPAAGELLRRLMDEVSPTMLAGTSGTTSASARA
ncbi:LysR family transcriptional regulator [Variovorax sp. KK3]|uniref:LysR family transcriptional regulator n=1 Tax=Variovorax sp. KK3 TaxID=1855728 RepID=UPI00097C1B13|nr:LysR family transcriptional regulator [Variovorax sp. KK3]